jgi:hypothetical protein
MRAELNVAIGLIAIIVISLVAFGAESFLD